MNVLDLFCGAAGGWSLGLARAGCHTVAACEIDPWRRSVFAASHPGCVMYADVRDLTADRLRADLGYLPDVVVGSPPCQQISAANTKGTGITDDHLFWEWARLVFDVRPVWCAAENSPHARTAGIDGILDALDQSDYAAWPLVVGAEDVGANHPRKRMWIVAADAARLSGGWIAGAERQSRPEAGPHALHSDPDGRLASGARRHSDGCIGLGAGENGDDAGHAPVVERLRQRRVRPGRSAEPAQADLCLLANSDRPGLALGPRLVQHDGEELPPALRDIGRAWPHWNGGLPGLAAACAAAGFGAVDDGPDHRFSPGLRNRAIAALGDAVLPQITEAIGKIMRKAFGVGG